MRKSVEDVLCKIAIKHFLKSAISYGLDEKSSKFGKHDVTRSGRGRGQKKNPQRGSGRVRGLHLDSGIALPDPEVIR